jgi:hypothetical protein
MHDQTSPTFQSEGKQTHSTKPPNGKSQANRKVGNAPARMSPCPQGMAHLAVPARMHWLSLNWWMVL